MKILISILVGIMAIIVVLAVAPAIEGLAVDLAGPTTFNCASDVDFNNSLNSNTLGCAIVPLTTPLLILGVIISVVMVIFYGPKQEEPQYTYGV